MNQLLNRYMTSAATFAPPDAPGAGPSAAPAASPGSSGTAAPAPGATSVPAEGGGENVDAGASSDSDDLFAGFSSDGHDEIEIQEPASEPGPDEAPPAAVPPPAPAAVPAPAVPPVEPVAAVPPVVSGDQNASTVDESDPTTIRRGMEANTEALQQWMASNVFKLSKEDLDALDLDAGAMIPKLLARGHFEATRNTLNLINNLVPQMVAKVLATTTAKTSKASEAMQEFFAAHTALNDKEHGEVIKKWSLAFRATNPKATRKEAIDFVGRAVMNELGITATATAAPKRPAPFAPARAGTRAPTSQEPESPYGGLGQDFDDQG